ncbi:MAG: ATP-binding protein [Eubacteriales bacterium]
MRRKFQRCVGWILCMTLLLTCFLFTGVLYTENVRVMNEDVVKEAEYISVAINSSDEEYIDEILDYIDDTRITIIAPDGEVLFDTEKDAEAMENHLSREEIQEALEVGEGSSTRISDTIGKQTYYYAILLDDGNVIRISKTMDSVLATVLTVLPSILLMGIILWVIAMLIARWQTDLMIKPINELNVDHPLDSEIYEELHPLLKRIDNSNKAREEVAEMRKEFSANVSHELKTPLTSISGYAELMQNGLVRQEDISRFAEKIYTEAMRLIMLVEDIIKLSKLDEGRIELEKTEVDLYHMIREICSRLSLQAEKNRVHIKVSGQSVKYRGVRQILDEMLYNICENAIKYNKIGGEIDIWVGSTLEGPKVIVRDTGIGIPEDQQERVFERFYRVDKSHSKATGGTGLGLSIVKHGAILHKANIQLSSKIEEGTKIEILFKINE